MMLRRSRRGARLSVAFSFGLGTFLAAMSFAGVAGAQSLDIVNPTSLPRVDADGQQLAKRPITLTPEGVSLQDCIDDVRIRFTVIQSGLVGNSALEAWASLSGADCKTQQNRSGANAVCWNLVTGIPIQQTTNVDIPVRKIMSGAPPFTPVAPATGEDMCGRVDLATINVQFLYFAPGQLATPATSKDIAVQVDTVGPSPPTGLTVKPGNTRIQVNWDNISGEGGVSVLTGVKAYCDVAASSGPTTITTEGGVERQCTTVPLGTIPEDQRDAGGIDTAGDAGFAEDGGTYLDCVDVEIPPAEEIIPGSDCASSNFNTTDGGRVIPDNAFNGKYQCGELTGNSGSALVATNVGGQPLANGTRYAVAVAATDAFGNVGTLSGLVCETPEETTDFWQDYKKSGGEAGGCATSRETASFGSMAALSLAAFFGMSIVLRVRKRGDKKTRSAGKDPR